VSTGAPPDELRSNSTNADAATENPEKAESATELSNIAGVLDDGEGVPRRANTEGDRRV
jgi:hypothetical protein